MIYLIEELIVSIATDPFLMEPKIVVVIAQLEVVGSHVHNLTEIDRCLKMEGILVAHDAYLCWERA